MPRELAVAPSATLCRLLKLRARARVENVGSQFLSLRQVCRHEISLVRFDVVRKPTLPRARPESGEGFMPVGRSKAASSIIPIAASRAQYISTKDIRHNK